MGNLSSVRMLLRFFSFILLDLFIVFLIPYRLDLFLFILLRTHYNYWLQWYVSFIHYYWKICPVLFKFYIPLFSPIRYILSHFLLHFMLHNINQESLSLSLWDIWWGSFLISLSSWGIESFTGLWVHLKTRSQLWVHSNSPRLWLPIC